MEKSNNPPPAGPWRPSNWAAEQSGCKVAWPAGQHWDSLCPGAWHLTASWENTTSRLSAHLAALSSPLPEVSPPRSFRQSSHLVPSPIFFCPGRKTIRIMAPCARCGTRDKLLSLPSQQCSWAAGLRAQPRESLHPLPPLPPLKQR